MLKVPNDEDPPKYNICSLDEDFSFLGNGVYFYLLYIRFLVFLCLIIIGINSAVEIFVYRKYNKELTSYCSDQNSNFYVTANSNYTCSKFKNATNNWIYSMNFENIGKFKFN